MSVKLFIYLFVAVIVIWSLDAVNINQIFKKNKVFQARVIYFLIAISLIQLVSTFIYDFYLASKIF